MKAKISIAVTLFLHLISRFGIAQNNDLRFILIEGMNKKPLGKINAITQDPHGYMWFAGNGENCIYRYDGIRMTAFKHDETKNSLGIHNPETVYADRKGIIWVGGSGGLDQYNPATGIFKHYIHAENDSGSLAGYVFVILKDRRGRIWAGTNNGLDQLDEKTGKFLHYRNIPGNPKSLSNNIVRAIYEDHSGVLWVGTGFPWGPDEGGLNRLNPDGTFTRYLHDPNDPHSLINNKVSSIFEDSRGIFWVGTSGYGLHTMDRSTGRFERRLYDPANPNQLTKPPIKGGSDHIIFIKEDNTGAIWIGTYNAGINRYDPDTKKITHYQTSNAAADSTCWTGFISEDGVLWVATQDSYLLYRAVPFHKTIRSITTGDEAWNFLEDKQGYLWVGTRGSGLFKYDQQFNLLQHFKHIPTDSLSLPNNIVGGLFQNQQNKIWVKTDLGVRVLDEVTKKFSRFDDRENLKTFDDSSAVANIFQDKQGIIWIARWGEGLMRYNPKDHSINNFYSKETDSSTISSNNVGQIFEDRSGVLWTGSDKGLNRLDKKTGKFVRYPVGNGWALHLYQDSEGDLWAGANKGLYRYDKKQDRFFNFFDAQSELNSTSFGGVTEDDAKNLWFFSQSAIISLNLLTHQTFIYDSKYGIVPYSMADWKAAYKNRKGQIFIPNGIGFYTFLPGELVAKTDFKIIITNLLINSLPVLPGKESLNQKTIEDINNVVLPYNQNNIAFNFAASDYREPQATRYFTMLENYDNTWRQVEGEKSSHYFNVSPGTYVFRIKAFNSDGTKAEKIITIYVNPPWWKTWWAYTLFALFLIVSVWAFIRRRIRALQKEKINLEKKVSQRTLELKEEKEIVEQTLAELKSTQAQLIHSEKMASLGELTAGIAHEIQNPLNFVNNFSEVNSELLAELKEEIETGNFPEVKTIAGELELNMEKIVHHGKRAESIVKGMLQHSHTSTGQREPTDLNALADEYLRLAYHGLRAKDKSFNATMQTDFDEKIGKISVVPQELSRVLLNLINNAFYAVTEKKKSLPGTPLDGYQPTVSVITKKKGNEVEITVRDNGMGIPDKIKDKIFQPFFTTKPTGQGTGLGLSLAYDIVKAHNGEIRLETIAGEGAAFIILLPAK